MEQAEQRIYHSFDIRKFEDSFTKNNKTNVSKMMLEASKQRAINRTQSKLTKLLDKVDRNTVRIQVALYEGTSFFPSRLIRWITWGDKSHAAWFYPEGVIIPTSLTTKQVVFGHDAWYPGGVRRLSSLSDGHKPGTKVILYNIDVTQEQLYKLVQFNESQVGKKYNWFGVLEFPPFIRFFLHIFSKKYMAQDPMDLPAWFCSALVLCGSIVMGGPFLIKDPRKTDPEDLETSPDLYRSGAPEETYTK